MFCKRHFLMLILLLGVSACGGGDDSVTPPSGPDTAAEYTVRGWQRFSSEHFDDALSDFNEALLLDANYGEAMAGRGWCGVRTATSATAMASAAAELEDALSAGESESYVLAGLAAVRLAQGGGFLPAALSHASTVLTTDPVFVFSHNNSFNAVDVRLIRAFAYAVEGEFSLALVEGDQVSDSGIDENIPSTWIVGGTDYSSFAAAVLAHLHQLSQQYSG